MHSRRPVVASLGSAFTLVVVIVAWIAFAPPQLGGQTSYVIVSGNSMEPGLNRGDLAVVRQASRYQVGDIVTYRHPQIGPVIHRIVAEDGARFVFQGDHNNFIDSYRPAQQELIGTLWFHIPTVGAWLTRFHSPGYAAGLLFVALVGLSGGSAAAVARRNRGSHRLTPHPASFDAGRATMQRFTKNWQDTVSILAAAGLALAVLAWVGFHRPVHQEVQRSAAYTQSGEFYYSAASADGRVYDSGAASSGDPVYRKLSDQVAVGFDYRFSSDAPANVSGSYQLLAELSDQSGWRRTIELGPVTGFTGTSFTANGVFDLTDAQSLIDVLEAGTGVKNEHYTVTFDPRVKVTGTVAGIALNQPFTAELPMQLDTIQLRMAAAGLSNDNPLKPSQESAVTSLRSESNTIRLLAFELPVMAARVLSLLGLALVAAISGSLLLAADQFRGPAGNEAERVAARYGRTLVSVSSRVALPGSRIVDVVSVDDLGRMAERFGSVILQEARPGYHCYFVHDGDITYRYQAAGRPAEAKAARGAA